MVRRKTLIAFAVSSLYVCSTEKQKTSLHVLLTEIRQLTMLTEKLLFLLTV